jgi:hypothetical protein
MSQNLIIIITTVSIVFVFVLIGAVLFTLRKPVLAKMLNPLTEVLDAVYKVDYDLMEFRGFLNMVEEQNKQRHRRFLKLAKLP